MTSSPHGHCLRVLGPGTPLAHVLTCFEADGHSDPGTAWQAFTGTWNWAAPLTTAVLRADVPAPAARPAPGGFAVSGQWRLPSHDGTGTWLALPLADPADGGSDLLVVSSKVLPCAVRGLPADGDRDSGDDSLGAGLRLEDAHVPAGLITRAGGEPLRAEDAAFLWTAVTALALGAARRMTDALADPPPGAGPRETAVSAELAAVLHDERQSLAAVLHDVPSARQGLAPSVEERLAHHVGQAGNAVRYVVAAAYERVLASACHAGGHPLVSLVEASSPILQLVRFARELLPRDDRTSHGKGSNGENRRISG